MSWLKNREGDYSAPKILGVCVLLIFVLILIFNTIVFISAGHRGVVIEMGRVTGRILDEGINIKAPFVQNVWVAEVRIQKEQVDASAASKDLQEVKSTIALNYHLDFGSVQKIYQVLGKDYKERIIDPAMQESFKAVTAEFNAAELLQRRPEVKEVARKLLEERLHKNNIIVDDLSIVNFDFSSDFNDAIEKKQVAQQNAERAAYTLEQARKEAEAQKVQKETLSPELLTKWAIEKWDGKMPQYVGGSGNILGIPINK